MITLMSIRICKAVGRNRRFLFEFGTTSAAVAALAFLFAAYPVSALTTQLQNSGNLLVMSNVNVTVQYNLTNGLAAFYWQNSKIISAFYSGVGFTSGNYGYIQGSNYTHWSWSTISYNEVMVTATGNGHPTMKQFFTFDQDNSFLVRLEMD